MLRNQAFVTTAYTLIKAGFIVDLIFANMNLFFVTPLIGKSFEIFILFTLNGRPIEHNNNVCGPFQDITRNHQRNNMPGITVVIIDTYVILDRKKMKVGGFCS